MQHDKQEKILSQLCEVIASLLGDKGCPWDKEQTPQTLTDYIIEEAFELVEAIGHDRPAHSTAATRSEVMEELGDVLFLLVFTAILYENGGHFTLGDCLEYVRQKMIRRHPHVFGDLSVADKEEILVNWEQIKRAEKTEAGELRQRVYASLPKGLPPMLRAYRIHSKAARAGFTWQEDAQQKQHMQKEWQEFLQAKDSGDMQDMHEEFGDYLFCLIEYGRRNGIKANAALAQANAKFLDRFTAMEDKARAQKKDISELSLEDMNALWDEVKTEQSAAKKE